MTQALLPSRPPTPRDDRGRAHGWQWYGARAAVVVCFAALLGGLWVLHLRDVEENRGELIRDILWVEQNVQFSLERDIEHLRQLAHDGVDDVERRQLDGLVNQLRTTSPALARVVVLDGDGTFSASAPGPTPSDAAAPLIRPASEPAYRLARSTGKSAYGPPYAADGDHLFEVFVPCFRGGAPVGMVVGIYSLRSILSGIVPWWLAEKHRVTIRDASGAVLAAKSNVQGRGGPELTHQTELDPPGHGLLLRVDSYGSPTKLLRNVLAVTLLSLAAAVLWTMWSLRHHIQLRLATERALRQEHAFRKAMEDSLETGLRAVDLEGRIIYVNPAFCRMVGWSERELTGHGAPQPYWPPEDSARIEAAQRNARAAGTSRIGIELELMRRSGERFDALLYETPLVDAQGRQTGWMASVLDITDRKRARQQEEKLAATARLVTMGEMASAIAHELNQPLSAIASYATGCMNLLASGAAAPGEIEDALAKTARQAERAGRVIRRVHEFVRKREPARSRLRLNAVVDEAIGFVEPEARKRGVRITALLARDDAELEGDPVLLTQVLLNLVRNGMDAMAATPPPQRELSVSTERTAGAVLVRVVDCGCGLSPDVQEKLFDPFFTTKPEGMGMGLNICRSIVELHRGRLWAEPAPGGGAAFSFSLPVERA
jgi:two-component system sensor histidine kinase DctS